MPPLPSEDQGSCEALQSGLSRLYQEEPAEPIAHQPCEARRNPSVPVAEAWADADVLHPGEHCDCFGCSEGFRARTLDVGNGTTETHGGPTSQQAKAAPRRQCHPRVPVVEHQLELAAGCEHAAGLGESLLCVRCVVENAPGVDEVELAVVEGQRLGVSYLEVSGQFFLKDSFLRYCDRPLSEVHTAGLSARAEPANKIGTHANADLKYTFARRGREVCEREDFGLQAIPEGVLFGPVSLAAGFDLPEGSYELFLSARLLLRHSDSVPELISRASVRCGRN
jgi:hypothetical protein